MDFFPKRYGVFTVGSIPIFSLRIGDLEVSLLMNAQVVQMTEEHLEILSGFYP